MINLAYQTFHNYCNSPKSSFQIASFDGISAIAINHPDFFDTVDVSTPIVEAYDKIKSVDDTVAIAALALIGSLLGTGNDLIIGSIFSMFDWSILTEIWNISSSDQKQIICEFINTAINASPIELSNALTNGVFSTLLCDFPSTDCNLKAESLLPVISATNIDPNAMLPIIIENGLIKVAGSMMEAIDDRYIQCGLQLIAALMNANFNNHELQELVKRDITDNSIESDVEALASGTQYADIASEVSTELNHFMEEE
ncbi:hypothetical protein TVAG_402690 [Trichomonas vaginalis G3]|uniref:Uncharacterized protein n=1 Tax=Trichomonas vaginalis (strain ATCC PRA-98 / G3) TaxID=412133 RepID=A2DI24_TRIV3|nr:armadillo (ARM) repeat-containing protein family [Trichomonas vaginalis G3]EAY20013.1 hypothetical protein TVAG_402690 [Trichomonas vaginalis G3]KAI5525964.1 armadillo (ARM) repeat-containing protein family [Trichomonas vaginalis G3]|eukprot:XP_001580999.1 hypothetical protein [Trichomonas vaginalis G3]